MITRSNKFSVLVIAFALVCMPFTGAQAADEGFVMEDEAGATAARDGDLLFSDVFDAFNLDTSIATYWVHGDAGRFRQDMLAYAQTSGGVDNVTVNRLYDNGWFYEMKGRAIVDYDYASSLLMKSPNDDIFEVQWRRTKKYWDGSAEPFVPGDYGNNPEEFAEFDDDDLYTDRSTVHAELQKKLSDGAKVIVAYDLWKRSGRETLLRGSRLRNVGNTRIARSRVATARVDGYSNMITLSAPLIFNEVHNVTPSISFEAYRDGQFIHHPRYDNGGLTQDRTFIDNNHFDDLKIKLKYNAWINEKLHVFSGYMFNFLRNKSARTSVRANLPGSNRNHYTEPNTNNIRLANIYNAGVVALDIFGIENLDFRGGGRVEHAITDANSRGMNVFAAGQAPEQRVAESNLQEQNFAESFTLTHKRKNTTVRATLDMEQRRLHWKERFDARGHELTTNFGITDKWMSYETDITYVDIVPRINIRHRFNDRVKGNLQYKTKWIRRFNSPNSDTLPGFYPGILGDQHRNVNELTAKVDVRLSQSWTSSLKYQFVSDNIAYSVGDRQQDLDRHRYSATVAGAMGKVFSYFSFMYDIYRIDTPTNPADQNVAWGPGKGAYDYNGNAIIIAANFVYPISEKLSSYWGYQHTGSLGDNANTLNKANLGLKYNISEHTSLEAGYSVFNFRDNRGPDGGFDDDYYGHGMSFAFSTALA